MVMRSRLEQWHIDDVQELRTLTALIAIFGIRNLFTIASTHGTNPGAVLPVDHRRIALTVRPGSDGQKRAEVMHEWHKSLLHDVVPSLIKKWELKLKIRVAQHFLQRMKTKWGSCNHTARHIRLNTQLVTKPKDLLEYVIVHEMVHLIEPTH
jgi:predicted metal-dependent hydrolase